MKEKWTLFRVNTYNYSEAKGQSLSSIFSIKFIVYPFYNAGFRKKGIEVLYNAI